MKAYLGKQNLEEEAKQFEKGKQFKESNLKYSEEDSIRRCLHSYLTTEDLEIKSMLMKDRRKSDQRG